MAKFPPYFLERLRDALSPSQVIGKYVRLQPKGRGEFQGLCPFHNEKTPSFTVSDDKGFYHCFGCGAHGDIVRFIVEQQRLSFPEAVELLANEAGLSIPKISPEEEKRYEQQKTLYEVNDLACRFFEENLFTGIGSAARDYLKKRGLSDETIKKFRLGFAPDSFDLLKNHLLQKGISEELQLAAAVISKNDDRPAIDRFRLRLMFPICDSAGRVVAFGGRSLSDDMQPKYLNSPETDLFKKGSMLYALNWAKEAAREKSEIILVEGYMDVIALHAAGVKTAVAPLGTALTDSQLKVVWKFAKEPVICLDGDQAGLRAMARVAENYVNLLQPDYSLKFAVLPPGQDPDDVIKASGAISFRQIISDALPLSEALWQINTTGKSIKTPEQVAGLENSLNKLVEKITNPAVKSYYRDFFKAKIWENFRRNKAVSKKSSQLKTSEIKQIKAVDVSNLERAEAALLKVIVTYPELLKEHGIEEEFSRLEFIAKTLDKTRDSIIKAHSLQPDISSADLHEKLKNSGDLPENMNFSLPRKENDIELARANWQYYMAVYNLNQVKAEAGKISDFESENFQEKLSELNNQINFLEKKAEEHKQILENN